MKAPDAGNRAGCIPIAYRALISRHNTFKHDIMKEISGMHAG